MCQYVFITEFQCYLSRSTIFNALVYAYCHNSQLALYLRLNRSVRVLTCFKMCTDINMTTCPLKSNCFWMLLYFQSRLRVVIDFMLLYSPAANFENAVISLWRWSFHKNMLTFYSHKEIFIFHKLPGRFYNSLQAVSQNRKPLFLRL